MSEMQWLLLVLVVIVVAGAYLYIRRQANDDPWQGMDEPGDQSSDAPGEQPYDFNRGVSLGGDSYIVGVRTIGQPQADGEPSDSQPRSQPQPQAQPQPKTQPQPQPQPQAKAKAKAKKDPPWSAFNPKSESVEKAAPETGKLRPKRAPAGEEKLFIVHVTSRDGSFFDGPDIHAVLGEQKLKFGMHNIYHRITEVNGVPDSVYSVANMLKPGFLDPVEQDHLSTPGLTMFLQLPGPIDGVKAARDLLETAGALAERLGGEVLDDKRSLLKAQTAQFMLDQAAELDRRQRVQAQR